MSLIFSLAGITGALVAGAVSPGPSFILVARTAMVSSRREGVICAFGMGVGSFLFALLAMLGLHALFAAVPWAYVSIKTLGGVYLLFLAWRLWKHAADPLSLSAAGGAASVKSPRRVASRAFFLALATQLSNPKTAIVMGGIFAAFLPRQIPPALILILPTLVFLIDIVWYSLVAWLLSTPAPRAAYLRYKKAIDRIASGILAALGLRLLFSFAEDAPEPLISQSP